MRKINTIFSIRSIGLLCLLALLALPQFAAAATPLLVKNINVQPFDFNGTIYFSYDDGVSGYELWKSDGTDAGTVLVKDINPGAGHSNPQWFRSINGTLYFMADSGSTGNELWKSDGTDAGTVLVKDINSGGGGSNPSLINCNGTLFLFAGDGANGGELWITDGTTAGTVLVKDIYPGSTGSIIQSPVCVGSMLYFNANDPVNHQELWKSDGTTAGTVLVKDINPGGSGSAPFSITNVNGILYFNAYEPTYNRELWKSDGTTAGTVLVKDITPNIPGAADTFGSTAPSNFSHINGITFFVANDGTAGDELWKTDGTAAGTVMVKDINPGAGNSVSWQFINFNNTLYFVANDGTNGEELWQSDGTAAGTVMVKDINPGAGGSSINYLTIVNGTLYFVADDGTHGSELWQSDGTAAGTVMVNDITPGSANSFPSSLISSNNNLYFNIYNGATYDLWVLDLTPPNASISSPSDGAPLSGATATISGIASDAVTGVQLVEVSTDNGGSWSSASDASGNGSWSSWSYSWSLPQNSASHTLIARSTDKAGNIGTSVSVTVTTSVVADSTAPTTTASPAGGTYSSAQNVTLSCNDGSGSGCGTIYYCLGSGCNPTTAYVLRIAISSNQILRFYSADLAGNSEVVKSETYTITSPDYANDGQPDYYWHNTSTGEVMVMFMNGTTRITYNYLMREDGVSKITMPSPWALKSVQDLNGDGKFDLLWHNPTTGEILVMYLNGTTRQSLSYITREDGTSRITMPSPWVLDKVQDLNGDNKFDMVWHNTSTGEVLIMYMNGTTRQSLSYITREDGTSKITLLAPWALKNVQDLNGDSKMDLVWHNPTSGEVLVMYLNGTTRQSLSYITREDGTSRITMPSPWVLDKVQDLNGDNKFDMVWHNTSTGEVLIMYMNGTTRQSLSYITREDGTSRLTLPSPWNLKSVQDLNGDNKFDLVWHNPATGEALVMYLNGTTRQSLSYITREDGTSRATMPSPWDLILIQ